MDYNNPYQQQREAQPNRPRPHIDPKANMASACLIIGVLALISAPMFTIFPALILGSISITIGLLSKGSQATLIKSAKIGILLATIALCIDTVIISHTAYQFAFNSAYREELDQAFEQVYGEDFDDVMRDILNGDTPNSDTPNSLPNNPNTF